MYRCLSARQRDSQPGSMTVIQAAWQSARQRDSQPGSMTVSQAAWQSARQRDSHVIFFHFHAETYLIPFRHIKRETRPSKELTDMKVSSDSGEIEVTVQHISTNLCNHHGIVYSFLQFFIIVFMSFYSFNHLYSFIDRQFFIALWCFVVYVFNDISMIVTLADVLRSTGAQYSTSASHFSKHKSNICLTKHCLWVVNYKPVAQLSHSKHMPWDSLGTNLHVMKL